METKEQTLPHWDMTPLFPALDSAEFEAEFRGVIEAIASLKVIFDANDARKRDDSRVDMGTAVAFESVTKAFNDLQDRIRTVATFIHSFIATDSRNDRAQALYSELQSHLVELNKLGIRYQAWIGSLDVETLLEQSALAREHAFAVRKAAEGARRQMTEIEEDLQASLAPASVQAWSKLHGNLTSRLQVSLTKPDGTTERLPMSSIRGLAHDPDAALREAAYRAELEAWETVDVPLAAALNSIKGWHDTLNRRRGWQDSVEPALFANNVDRGTLEAMQQACVESFPDFRRYLRAKAQLLGHGRLPWWDLFAPVGGGTKRWEYPEATSFIVERFGSYSDRLAGLADRAFREDWIDAEPRVGKRDGAFCMGVRDDESRVMLNYTGRFGSVSTLAHELGHAYHNINLAHRTPLQRQTPMALAETASIFCQTIVMTALLADAGGDEKLAILEGELEHACQIVVDIHSRFLFEKGVFERRGERELSVSELNELMLDAQRQTYGDGLDPEALHPYMWAVKPHYYSTSYYNWPYTFGFLFGLGLYARYREDPDGFRAGYDDLLSSTGLDDAASLAARFGIEVRTPEFWRSSLDVVREQIGEFEAATG